MDLFISKKLFLHLFSLILVPLLYTLESNQIRCLEKERQALFLFRESLEDDHGILSSWQSDDCCEWEGVGCSNRTGHVTALVLPYLSGKLRPSLLELEHLKFLDLSFFHSPGSVIPEFIGSLRRLKYLNLSSHRFAGVIPDRLGNLSNLHYLDLSSNKYHLSPNDKYHIYHFDQKYDLAVKNLNWLSHLSSLRHLDLSGVNLSKADDWPQAINRLPLLTVLKLSDCELPIKNAAPTPLFNHSMPLSVLDLSINNFGIELSRIHGLDNFSSLTSIRLSKNFLFGLIPEDLGKIRSLKYLYMDFNMLEGEITNSIVNLSSLRVMDLSYNRLHGIISPSFGKLTKLEELYLKKNQLQGGLPEFLPSISLRVLDFSHNRLSGTIPASLWKLPKLENLQLSENQFEGALSEFMQSSSLRFLGLSCNLLNGTIPTSMGNLTELEVLELSSNRFTGRVSEVHLQNLFKLRKLKLSYNSLILTFKLDWVPPFNLTWIELVNCKIGPHFPSWLQNQRYLEYIDASGSGIDDSFPNWFGDKFFQLFHLNLSNNHIHGFLPQDSLFDKLYMLDLGSCNIEGPMPKPPHSVKYLSLSKNKFRGSIDPVCNMSRSLRYLDLSNNHLSGSFPDCLVQFEQLGYLKLGHNNFLGPIPSLIGQLTEIRWLHLQNNSLDGELPISLKQCQQMRIIDIGQNKFSGKIPSWLGRNLPKLALLSLRSNKFEGTIPSNVCHLKMLQILDLSDNNIVGTIPNCFGNFTAMAEKGSPNSILSNSLRSVLSWWFIEEAALLMWKGIELEYKNTLGLVKAIDLSRNNLTGEIPSEITYLEGLVALNISRNNLNGNIPLGIGNLKLLEFLDLSRNQLSGVIPISLSQLNFIGFLDFSSNNLSGKIPSSTQLQSFNASSYSGNPGLCGLPLPNSCLEDQRNSDPGSSQESDGVEQEERFLNTDFCTALGIGFAVGLSGTLVCLLVNNSQKVAYFRLVSNLQGLLYVAVIAKTNKLRSLLT